MDRKIPVFLSVGEPHRESQKKYLDKFIKYLNNEKIEPITLGRNEYDIRKPLVPVRKRMKRVFGAIILAMERFHCLKGVYREGSGIEEIVEDIYFSTTWNHIEAAMAYQLDLPLLILKERKLYNDGIFDPSIHDWIIVNININTPSEIRQQPIKGFINSWIDLVREKYYKSK